MRNKSEFEIIDIDLKNISNKRNIDEITVNDIITLSKVIYSLYSGNIDVESIVKLTGRIVKIASKSLPKQYDFIKKIE